MERYKVIKEVGDGTFGSVFRAINKQTGEIVAIKKMKKKYQSWDECMNLREVKSLRRMNHPNIVKLKEVIRENEMLFFVFEFMECNLYELMKNKGKPFTEEEVRSFCFQVFQALAHMHQRGYFHRDLKPENLLVTKDVIKVADFGLARETTSNPPYTEYVSTRWYRAPEVLLQASFYNSAVDMWAMGAIIAELFTLRPLFPGSSEVDEMYKICSVIGTPNMDSWPEGLRLAADLKFQFPMCEGVNLFELIPNASKDAISLISWLCSWDPAKRPTAQEALQHSFFQPCYYVPPSLRFRSAGILSTPPSVGMKGASIEQKSMINNRKYPQNPAGTLSYSKPAHNNMNTNNIHPNNVIKPPYKPTVGGVQRKLDLDHQGCENNNMPVSNVRQYQGKPNYAGYNGAMNKDYRKVSEVTDTLSQMSVRSNPQNNSNYVQNGAVYQHPFNKQQMVPSNFRSGGWHGQNNYEYVNKRAYEIPSARNHPTRKEYYVS
ncbi:hypothetical protein LUZ60_007316 [Juncus effusus]|nr:hypothetical protein LUZ60_007316 [Juncus effusus]